ncbi:MAG: C2 family cysteine protease, partial [Brachybacterium sp.]|nr:C2 family cysteine protease [Brachybacterium sp.]
MAALLAIHEAAPERIGRLLEELPDGTVRVHLPGRPVVVDRRMPVDTRGQWVYAHLAGARRPVPGWPGVVEKALAIAHAGSYRWLARGIGRSGLGILTGLRVRTVLRRPSPQQILQWRSEGRAVLTSTHPLSPRWASSAGPLPRMHVFAVVGADEPAGTVALRNPWDPDRVVHVGRRAFRW